MKTATAPTPSRQESTQAHSFIEPQVNTRPADKWPEPVAQGTTPPPAPSPVPEFGPTVVDDDQIRNRAYELYVADGSQDGNHEDHWLAAEREIRSATANSSRQARTVNHSETD